MFNVYWKSCREAKLAYICGHVKQLPVKRRYTDQKEDSRRQKTRLFYLTKSDSTTVRVCKEMLGRALKREGNSETQSNCSGFQERCGKREPANKTSQDVVKLLRDILTVFHAILVTTAAKTAQTWSTFLRI